MSRCAECNLWVLRMQAVCDCAARLVCALIYLGADLLAFYGKEQRDLDLKLAPLCTFSPATAHHLIPS